ncbi:MAG: hypothetical protein JKY70_09115 [Mucilaginibacter sp.]|nr:hypothetical protein [Mucilaginibacter sp.]
MLKPLILSLFSLTILIFLEECKFGKEVNKEHTSKEFEGIITYHEIFKNIDSSLNVDDTVQVFYSHGNYVGVHSEASQNFHLIKDYYFQKEPLRLLLFNDSDTLHQMNLNFSIERLDSFKVKKIKDKIFSRQCESIDLNTSYTGKDSITYTDFSFIFSRGYLNVDKEHFKNWKLGFFNKVINETGAFYLNLKAIHFDSSHKNILSFKTNEVISVKEQSINPAIFKIDLSKIKRSN